MNIDTGELVRLEAGKQLLKGFVPVPQELVQEADQVLGDKQSAFIDLNANTPLAQFAHSQQAKRNKNRRKMAKASKRRNRR